MSLSDTRNFLWALCYRMSGNPADADELVQETYARALKVNQTSRPYLTRVAINLSRDLLRTRRRRGYDGPWLPGPIETKEQSAPEPTSSERYDLLESVSFAFLLALEALTPAQRAVLVLVDVFDYSAQEVADVLGVKEGNVRVIHHRARKAMEMYEHSRIVPTAQQQAKTRAALEKFLGLLFEQDVKGIEELLAKDVKALSDGGGEFHASKVPLLGPERVSLFYRRLAKMRPEVMDVQFREFNGMPAFTIRFQPTDPKLSPFVVMMIDLAEDGTIRQVYSQLATRKLSAVA